MTALWREIQVSQNAVKVVPCASLRRTYLKENFFCEYEGKVDLRTLDESLAAIPFLLAVAPTVWFSGKVYRIPRMPVDLFESLRKAKHYIKQAYPAHNWDGDIVPDDVQSASPATNTDRIYLLYSGGVDSAFSRLRYPKQPHTLVCVWGADIPVSQGKKWDALRSRVAEIADATDADTLFVRSNLEQMIKRKSVMPDIPLWWSYIQHGLGLVGLAYPPAIIAGAQRIVLSSSNTVNYDPPWGSHPNYEGVLVAAGVAVTHEGFDKDRKEKLYALVHEAGDRKPMLAVCQAAYTEKINCCVCEKCLRTIAGLLVEGADPQAYGFAVSAAEARGRMERGFASYRIKMTRDKADDWETVRARGKELSGSVLHAERKALVDWLHGMDFVDYNKQYQHKHWWVFWLRRQVARMPLVFDVAREINDRWNSR